MCHWNKMYWETYLSDQLNMQASLYFFKNLGPRRVFGQNGIDITWNNDQKVTANDRHKVIFIKMTQYCYSRDLLCPCWVYRKCENEIQPRFMGDYAHVAFTDDVDMGYGPVREVIMPMLHLQMMWTWDTVHLEKWLCPCCIYRWCGHGIRST